MSKLAFEDRVAMITGGSDGIGLATAIRLATQGATVVICGRRAEMLEKARDAVAAAGGRPVETLQLDVADLDRLSASIEDVAERYGRLDHFVGNAFAATFKPTVSMTIEEWRRVFTVNVDATFVGTSAALKIMYRQRRGSIVNVGSQASKLGMPYLSAYAASKAALSHYSTVVAMEAAEYGVRVNTIVPGSTHTANHAAREAADPTLAAAAAAEIPLGREGSTDEIAAAIAFLLSDDAGFITGTELIADGGYIPIKRSVSVTPDREART
ncbi:SDR family NAD(P)-dependent oxidoreductase [Sphingobium sp. TKS]|uniref:SDR family NAD(P)-dependent oxidoreductase n=1 Tax=Sphingobium sp. TKS TaxID=1315974 RepID=UPI00076FEDC3|nr:SDR family NAD(P)-dependent oxidoreductase [Sphingobium sp. TKS]AMK25616.1 short-chain dehydrogenase/reductase SDR [Sphingobium sp. TKS]